MTTIRPAVLVTVLAVLAGCKAGPYIEPQEVGSPQLILKSEVAARALYSTFDDGATCQYSTFKRLAVDESGDSHVPTGESRSLTIRPDQPFTLYARYLGVTWCSVMVTFVPQKNNFYLATFRDKGDRCYLSIKRRETSGDGRSPVFVPEPSAWQREVVAGGANGGSACK
jgi:hypothetical protein